MQNTEVLSNLGLNPKKQHMELYIRKRKRLNDSDKSEDAIHFNMSEIEGDTTELPNEGGGDARLITTKPVFSHHVVQRPLSPASSSDEEVEPPTKRRRKERSDKGKPKKPTELTKVRFGSERRPKMVVSVNGKWPLAVPNDDMSISAPIEKLTKGFVKRSPRRIKVSS